MILNNLEHCISSHFYRLPWFVWPSCFQCRTEDKRNWKNQRELKNQKRTFLEIIEELQNLEHGKSEKIQKIQEAIEEKILFLEKFQERIDEETRVNILLCNFN